MRGLRRPFAAGKSRWPWLALGLALVAAGALHATPPKVAPGLEGPLSFEEQATVAWTLVPAVVYDRRGLAQDLSASRFRLWVDDRPVPVASFDEQHDAPLSLLFLQDLSGSMANEGKLDLSRLVLRRLLDQLTDDDEIAIASFASGAVRLDAPFGQARSELERLLTDWRGYGTTAVYDALSRLPSLAPPRGQKRAAILLTDGVDNASSASAVGARDQLRRADIPVYALVLNGDRPPSREHREPSLLRLLAETSGGRYFSIEQQHDALAAAPAIAAELRHRYTLGFRTRSDGPIRQHQLRVEVSGSVRTVRHRQSYLGFSPLLSP